jgi:hypothetical protein
VQLHMRWWPLHAEHRRRRRRGALHIGGEASQPFAGVALLLAAIGTYGVLSYLVTERQREIGIRVALGASAGGIVRLVLRQGLSMSVLEIAIGVAGALGSRA